MMRSRHREPDERRGRGTGYGDRRRDDYEVEPSGDITAGRREIRVRLSYVIGLGLTVFALVGVGLFNSGRAVQSAEDGREEGQKEIAELKADRAADRAVLNSLVVDVAVIKSHILGTAPTPHRSRSALGMRLPLFVPPTVLARDHTAIAVRMPSLAEGLPW